MSAGYDIPAELAGHLRIGTCSWKYDSWKGLVYDPGRVYRPEDYLADYARHFNTVEIDQWFWSLFAGGVRLPDPDVVRRYAGRASRRSVPIKASVRVQKGFLDTGIPWGDDVTGP